ncbi:unnamed protein product [Linum tenue]|uniref:S-protein homolog n=1 Tax=Linum tenue TaxID=586396 RepID=A0AAV0LSS8_9ROSI|nr:unnamed protein product [Linum tenue]
MSSTMVTAITTRSPLLLLVLIVALALAGTSSAWKFPSLWPYKHVHVINELTTYKGVLHVHCWSGKDDRGHIDVAVGTEFTWRFKPNIWGTTKWTCELSTDDHRYASFDAYWEDNHQGKREYKHNIYWVAKEDGVYLRLIKQNVDQYWTKWSSGFI